MIQGGMTNRGFIYILATLIVGLNVFTAFAEPEKFDPERYAQTFMAAVGEVQAETSIPVLKETKVELLDGAGSIANILSDKKAQVEAIRKKLKDLDDAIQTSHIKLAIALGSGNIDMEEALLKTLENQRKQLVSEEEKAYKDYATYRGRAIVKKIFIEVIVKEIDKRIEQLGNNTASGTWSATYTADDGSTTPQGGDFSLLIDTNGTISGLYHEVGGEISVSGTWNPASGACSGVGNDPSSPATWSGTLKKGAGGYTGNGSLSYKPNAGGSGAGSWETTK